MLLRIAEFVNWLKPVVAMILLIMGLAMVFKSLELTGDERMQTSINAIILISIATFINTQPKEQR